MTVERIKLTPDRMIVKSAAGNSVFDTQNKYIKTAASGNLFVNKQIVTPLYYTIDGVVKAPLINGAHLRTIYQTDMLSGAQVSFKYPEFSGKLSIVPYIQNSGGGSQLAFVALYRAKITVNGQNLVVGGTDFPGVAWRSILFRDSGGTVVTPALRNTDEVVPDGIFNPGDTIVVGGVDAIDPNTGAVATANVTQIFGLFSLGFFAYQTSGTTLPLQVTV
jgi:hypothetical protein